MLGCAAGIYGIMPAAIVGCRGCRLSLQPPVIAFFQQQVWSKPFPMITALLILHVAVSVALIIIVLLQAGKGAEAGASFGGGASQTMFGASGGKTFLSKLTTSTAVIFMLTSLALAYLYGRPGAGSLMPETLTVAPLAEPTAENAENLPEIPADSTQPPESTGTFK